MFTYIFIGIVFFIILIIIIQYHQFLILKNLIIKIEEATQEIEILLEKKIELLSKISKIISKLTDKKILGEISKIKNKKLDIFQLEQQLYKLKNQLNNYKEDNNIVLNDEEQLLIKKLENNDLELKSLKIYYNKETETYNEKIKKLKYLIIKCIKKYNKKELFIIKKEVEFEILKNDNR